MSILRKVSGGTQLEEWFGYLPNFHDAEVVSLELRRGKDPSVLSVHAWRSNSDLDESGHFRRDCHAIINFIFSGIVELSVSEWNHQNVLDSLEIDEGSDGYVIALKGNLV